MDFALTESQELIKKEVGALARTFSLDYWLDSQEKNEIPLSVHALLTHLVDEASAACGELQRGVEGATTVTPTAQINMSSGTRPSGWTVAIVRLKAEATTPRFSASAFPRKSGCGLASGCPAVAASASRRTPTAADAAGEDRGRASALSDWNFCTPVTIGSVNISERPIDATM